MSVIYQVWWGRRSFPETFWFWGVVVGGLLMDVPYWVAFAIASANFPSIFGNICSDIFENYSIYIYLIPAVAVKVWLGSGLLRSEIRSGHSAPFVLKILAVLAVTVLVPSIAFMAYVLTLFFRAGCS